MRILVLIIQFPPDVNTSGLLMAQLCEDLVRRGHDVSVLTTFPHYAAFRIWDEYRGRIAQRSSYNGMDVLRLWVYASGSKHSMRNRLLSYVSFNAMATIAGVAARQEFDCILCSNGSFFSGLSAYLIGAVKRAPFIYNVQDLYPETPVQAGQLKNRPAIRILERLERFMYARAGRVSVIAPSFRENIASKGVARDKISVIPNFVDTEFIRPLPKVNDFSRAHGLTDKFVVTQAGNLGYVYDLETLLEAAELLRSYPDVVFLIVGDGVAKSGLEAKVRQMGLPNVRFLPFQPRRDLPNLRAASDVQVALYKRGAARYSMPSKVYEIMASGRPALASADVNSDLWKLIVDTGCGVCVEPHDPSKLASAVLTLYHDRQKAARMGQLGRQTAEATYSREVVACQYDNLIRSIALHRG